MTIDRNLEFLHSLIRELVALPSEEGWVEFKVHKAAPEEIGENISALANSAALCGKVNAYLVWGIKNGTHDIVGTNFVPQKAKKGNEELESWLLRLLKPKIHFKFISTTWDRMRIIMLEIPRASYTPVQFQGKEYIRVGSYKKKLKDYPEKERELWRIFDQIPFEEQIAAEKINGDEVVQLLDYPKYFQLLDIALPDNREGIMSRLKLDNIIIDHSGDRWDITNLGAILFANNLQSFKHLGRKAFRVIKYRNNTRQSTVEEIEGKKGYAVGFEGLVSYIKAQTPGNEVIKEALRKTVPVYPEVAIRELVANAIIHQDFSISGTGPMVEMFSDRVEITNPGIPLVETQRFLDSPPRSRNEHLASLMRRFGICEERGSGIDKVVFETEFHQLPAPLFETPGGNTRVVLFGHRPFRKMDKYDRIRACYLHACLRYVGRELMINTSLRKRFGIKEKNLAVVSRIIRDTMHEKQIKQYDPSNKSKKYVKYVPFWA